MMQLNQTKLNITQYNYSVTKKL